MLKRTKRNEKKNYVTEFSPRSQGNCFGAWVLVAKLPGIHLRISWRSRIPWAYSSLYSWSTIYFELLQRNQGLLCNGNWEGAISAMKILLLFWLTCSVLFATGAQSGPGVRFSKLPKSFRARKVFFRIHFLTILGSFCAKQANVLLDLVKLSNFLIWIL